MHVTDCARPALAEQRAREVRAAVSGARTARVARAAQRAERAARRARRAQRRSAVLARRAVELSEGSAPRPA